MANQKVDQTQKGTAEVTEFLFDESIMQSNELKILIFEDYCEEWAKFVVANRNSKSEFSAHDYDIVYGPVANDRVYAAFALYEGGLLDKQSLISELKTYKLVDQYLFHTEQALQTLTFIEAKEVAR